MGISAYPINKPFAIGDIDQRPKVIRRAGCREERLWHLWLRINRVLCVMLHTRWSAEAWSEVRVEFKRALALRSEIRRAGWFN